MVSDYLFELEGGESPSMCKRKHSPDPLTATSPRSAAEGPRSLQAKKLFVTRAALQRCTFMPSSNSAKSDSELHQRTS